jgi:UDP-N-acetyl-D-mannosaminuronic acid dehydrogenase
MEQPFKKVSVIGLGYIGLPTAAVIANRGVQVIGIDVSEKVVKTINEGRVHIVEPSLDVMVRGAVNAGQLKASLIPEEADAFLIAVPTPFDADMQPDLSCVKSAVEAIAPVIKKGDLVILESTSPVGTTEYIAEILAEKRSDLKIPTTQNSEGDIYIAHCPERVLPGQVLRELVENDRVIGGINQASAFKARDLYGIFVKNECHITDSRTAEMVKLTENAFRDVNIAFANELSMIGDKLKINVWELIELANRHPRVNILSPGPGVGGHCIAVDPWFIIQKTPDLAKVIRTARETNVNKEKFVKNVIKEKADKFKSPVIACLGLAFKPNIDDLRESPALSITKFLAENCADAEIIVVEPNIESLPDSLADIKNIVLEKDVSVALQKADIVAFLVKHKQFVKVSSDQLQEKVVFDFVDALNRR